MNNGLIKIWQLKSIQLLKNLKIYLAHLIKVKKFKNKKLNKYKKKKKLK